MAHKKRRTSKWLKWKVGAFSAIGLAVLFQGVKASPAFEQAHLQAVNAKTGSTTQYANQSGDSVMNQWQSQYQDNNQSQGNYAYGNSNGYSNPQPQFHTRTTRS